MPTVADRAEAPTAIQTNLVAIFTSLELSRSICVGSHLGVRISNFGPKKPSNGVCLTFRATRII